MTKEKALSILFSCADQYKSNLADRNWLLLWGTSSPSIPPEAEDFLDSAGYDGVRGGQRAGGEPVGFSFCGKGRGGFPFLPLPQLSLIGCPIKPASFYLRF